MKLHFQKEEAADDAGMFKLIKLFRVLRLFKIARHFAASQISADAFLMPMFFLQIFVLMFASLIYFMEGGDPGFMHTHGHEEFVMKYGITGAVFSDIFNAAYFIMVTITTVGYSAAIVYDDWSNHIKCDLLLP